MLKYKLLIRLLLFSAGFILIFFSYFLNKDNFSIKDGNTIFVVDISNSMNVKDVFYNNIQISRLNLIKEIIKDNIKESNKPVGLVLISSKIKYFIPPTKDKDIFLTYLSTLNTNTIRGGESNLKENLKKLNKLIDFADKVIIFSDFDTEDNLDGIKFNFTPYLIGIGTSLGGIVKDKDGKNIYLQGELSKSSLNKNEIRQLGYKYKIISSYKKGMKLDYLEDKYISLKFKGDIDILKYIGFGLVLLGL